LRDYCVVRGPLFEWLNYRYKRAEFYLYRAAGGWNFFVSISIHPGSLLDVILRTRCYGCFANMDSWESVFGFPRILIMIPENLSFMTSTRVSSKLAMLHLNAIFLTIIVYSGFIDRQHGIPLIPSLILFITLTLYNKSRLYLSAWRWLRMEWSWRMSVGSQSFNWRGAGTIVHCGCSWTQNINPTNVSLGVLKFGFNGCPHNDVFHMLVGIFYRSLDTQCVRGGGQQWGSGYEVLHHESFHIPTCSRIPFHSCCER
jgi:hypothetical protein